MPARQKVTLSYTALRNAQKALPSMNASTDTDGTIQPQSIRDHFCLGKFKNSSQKQQCQPRLKFIRSADVSSILSKRRSLQQPFSIKPDMSTEEHSHDSTLMKEGWSLIQSGTDRKYLNIQILVSIYITSCMGRSIASLVNSSEPHHPLLHCQPPLPTIAPWVISTPPLSPILSLSVIFSRQTDYGNP